MNELSLDQIAAFLSSTPLFGSYDTKILKKIASMLGVISLHGGQVLMHQNQPGDSLYIVMIGRLQASILTPSGEEKVGEIGHGELVGEIALLIGENRTATVRAIRDSLLLEFTKDKFDQLSKSHPEIAMDIARFCVKRLVKKKHQRGKDVTLVFAPASKNPLFSEFVKKIADLLETVGPILYLNHKRFDELYGSDAAETPADSERNTQITQWLYEQENHHRFIIYETDDTLTHWTMRCLRQADHILLVGLFGEDPSLNEIENELMKSPEFPLAKVDLVLLHETNNSPVNTNAWLSLRDVNDHFHVRTNLSKDYAKLLRFLTERTLGLVLAGGGTRSAAYIGLFRALEELKINIDIIGGNSAGAFLGGLYAKELRYKEIAAMYDYWLKNFKYNYTFPVISVFTGKFISESFQEQLGHVCIEDLWTKFFCISSNLSQNKLHIYEKGELWKCARASGSIPGLFPPIIDENGEMFVDGGIINNMPVDVMRKRVGSSKILAINLSATTPTKYDQIDVIESGWKLLFEKMFLPESRKKVLPTVGEIITSSMILTSTSRTEEMMKEADYVINLDVSRYGLLDMRGTNELINFSYLMCLQQLENFFNL